MVEVVGDSGAICQLEAHPVSVDQRAVQPGDDTLIRKRLIND